MFCFVINKNVGPLNYVYSNIVLNFCSKASILKSMDDIAINSVSKPSFQRGQYAKANYDNSSKDYHSQKQVIERNKSSQNK